MQITDVRIRKVEKEGKMKAVVSITIDEEFVVHDIKVIEGDKGLFIAMPSRKAADGEYRDIAHPINSDTRERIQTLRNNTGRKPDGSLPRKINAHRFYGKVKPVRIRLYAQGSGSGAENSCKIRKLR